MVDDVAVGTESARTGTRVSAFLPHTSQVASTLGVNGAFRSAVGRGAGVLR